jgi:protocatechuate 3,4-dioxygenase beta subunit
MVGIRGNEVTSAYEPFTKAVTDADGNYRLANITAGTYQLTIAAPAYVPADRADRKVVVLGEDENVDNINFSLVRGGVITGKITDAEGRPVIQHQVEVFDLAVIERFNPQQRPFPTFMGQTDDRGVYRIFGIAPGRYKVGAGRGGQGYGGFSPNQPNYRQVFYPDAVDPAKAQIIEVSEGSEAKDIDIALGAAVQTFSASGRVINSETGAPVRNIRFGLQRIIAPERFEFVNSVAVTNARGDFVVEGLIPGKYSTTMFSGEANELRAEPITFDVVDQDVSGVVVKLARGATVSGVVVLESDVKAAQRLLAETMMRGYVQSKTGYGNSASSPIAADGSFRLSGLPTGAVNISISGTVSPYPPKGLSISRIERDGIVRPRIEVKIGEQVTGVKVFIGYGTGILRGVVKIENGPLPSTARVFVQLRKPGENAPNLRFAQLDERGYFLMEGLAPGQYEVLATVVGGNLKSPKPIRQEVSLNDGAVTEVTITVDVATLTTPQ